MNKHPFLKLSFLSLACGLSLFSCGESYIEDETYLIDDAYSFEYLVGDDSLYRNYEVLKDVSSEENVFELIKRTYEKLHLTSIEGESLPYKKDAKDYIKPYCVNYNEDDGSSSYHYTRDNKGAIKLYRKTTYPDGYQCYDDIYFVYWVVADGLTPSTSYHQQAYITTIGINIKDNKMNGEFSVVLSKNSVIEIDAVMSVSWTFEE